MKKKHWKILLIIGHVIIWTIPILLIELSQEDIILGVFNSRDFNFFYPLYYGLLFNIFAFYFSVFFLMPKLLEKKGILLTLLGNLLFFLIVSLIETALDSLVIDLNPELKKNFQWDDILYSNLILNIPILLIAYVYFFLNYLIKTERNRNKLREEKLQMELDFLKSQVNPHFVFNTLNNLYGTARLNRDEKTANGIARLSSLLRYMLYETNADMIPLAKEIDYLKSFIELQKMRFTEEDDISIEFNLKGNPDNIRIAPILLVPILENAFKFGISLKEHSYIHILLEVSDNSLRFFVENSNFNKLSKQKENSGGLGLKNLKRRLELIYPESHKIRLEEKKENYLSELIIYFQ
jgi:hypothetical protein